MLVLERELAEKLPGFVGSALTSVFRAVARRTNVVFMVFEAEAPEADTAVAVHICTKFRLVVDPAHVVEEHSQVVGILVRLDVGRHVLEPVLVNRHLSIF